MDPVGGFRDSDVLESILPAFRWVWAVLVTTTSVGITVKLVGPSEAPHLFLFSYFLGFPAGWSLGRGGRRSRCR